ncbi:RapZ C-terminal domain-containing protein [Streptomyces bauhiniae]
MTTPFDLSPLYPEHHIQVVITSFGYGHSPSPEADITLDTRRHLRNPHSDPAMRDLNGLDFAVRQHVLTTPGARSLITNTALLVKILLSEVADARQRLVTIAVGCVGGRHRSVAIAEEIAGALRVLGTGVEVEHRDIDKPVIQN